MCSGPMINERAQEIRDMIDLEIEMEDRVALTKGWQYLSSESFDPLESRYEAKEPCTNETRINRFYSVRRKATPSQI